jgi:hypothetical protein
MCIRIVPKRRMQCIIYSAYIDSIIIIYRIVSLYVSMSIFVWFVVDMSVCVGVVESIAW